MCHRSEQQSQESSRGVKDRPFLCAPYVTEQEGRLRPVEGIDRCPLATVGETCGLRKHDFRDRKTGPEFALRILYCRRHRHYFTVYPPGHVPYGRQAIAPLDEQGRVVAPGQEAARWRSTLFRRGAGCCGWRALAA